MENQPTSEIEDETTTELASGKSIALTVIVLLLAFGLIARILKPPTEESHNTNTNTEAKSLLSNSTLNTNAKSPTHIEAETFSPSQNLAAAKGALSHGDKSNAKIYLSAIPKGSREYAIATPMLRYMEIEGELASLEREAASQDKLMDQTEDFSDEGTLKKGIYLNAFKKRAEIQIKIQKLERELKRIR
jgi:hypothetical protein